MYNSTQQTTTMNFLKHLLWKREDSESTLLESENTCEDLNVFHDAREWTEDLTEEEKLAFQHLSDHQGARVITAVALAFNGTFSETEEVVKVEGNDNVEAKISFVQRVKAIFKRKVKETTEINEPRVRDFISSNDVVFQMRDNNYWLETAASIASDGIDKNIVDKTSLLPIYFILSSHVAREQEHRPKILEALVKIQKVLDNNVQLTDTVKKQLSILHYFAFMKPTSYTPPLMKSILQICETWNEQNDSQLAFIESEVTEILQYLKSVPKTSDSHCWFRATTPPDILMEMETSQKFSKFKESKAGRVDPVWAAGRVKQLLRRIPGGIVPEAVKQLLLLQNADDDFIQVLIPLLYSFSPVRARLIAQIQDITEFIAKHSTGKGVTIETLTRVIPIAGELPVLKTLAEGQKFEREHDLFCKRWASYVPTLLQNNFTSPPSSTTYVNNLLHSSSNRIKNWYIPARYHMDPELHSDYQAWFIPPTKVINNPDRFKPKTCVMKI